MPRFAILRHDWPMLHWDVFLEAGPVLRSWRLLAEPISPAELPPGGLSPAGTLPDASLTVAIPAEPIPDHRLVYLDYEGPVSGGRGTVTRFDAGTFDWLEESATRVRLRLLGGRLVGLAELRKADTGWVWSLASS